MWDCGQNYKVYMKKGQFIFYVFIFYIYLTYLFSLPQKRVPPPQVAPILSTRLVMILYPFFFCAFINVPEVKSCPRRSNSRVWMYVTCVRYVFVRFCYRVLFCDVFHTKSRAESPRRFAQYQNVDRGKCVLWMSIS